MQAMQVVQDPAVTARSARLLTADEVSAALGVDVSTIYRMAADGRLDAVKVGRQWRFPSSVLPDAAAAPAIDPQAAYAAIAVAADLLGVMMVVTDLAGRPLTPVANPCPRFADATADELAACAEEWRERAADRELAVRFRTGALGFECASAFIRGGDRLLGMVLAGGIAPLDHPDDELYQLSPDARTTVLSALPRVAATVAERSAP